MRFAIHASKSPARVRVVVVVVVVDIMLVLTEYFAIQLASNIAEAWCMVMKKQLPLCRKPGVGIGKAGSECCA